MKVSDYIAETLEARGIHHVYEVVGGMIAHIVDSIDRNKKIQLVSMHHEQAAAFAADATGRLTGRPGVAMATSGPGATNLLTGIGSAFFDSSPTIFITGQVNRSEQKGARAIRQLGFQETDIVSMVLPITKAAWKIENAEEVPESLERAFNLAVSGRPGPVLIDIPMDIQRAELNAASFKAVPVKAGRLASAEQDFMSKLTDALVNAKRPLILVGGGLRSGLAVEEFRKLAERLQIPSVHSLMGVDILPFSNPLRIGMIGSYGNRWANLALGRSDLLLVMGSRLDIRQTGSQTKEFKGSRALFHVDCDQGEMNNRVLGCETVRMDIKIFLEKFTEFICNRSFPARLEWLKEIAELKSSWPDTGELKGINGINPNRLMHELSRSMTSAAVYVADVGQHQMWAAQSLELKEDQRFLTSGGMGAMGFALPAAIGAAFVNFRQPIVLIAGDGGFQLNIQELQTVKRNDLNIKMVILNNRCHGMVRQFQESYFDKRYPSTFKGYSAPDFTKVAKAYGIDSFLVADETGLESGLAMLSKSKGPFLLEVTIVSFTNVYPKIAFGHPITEMEPMARPLGMEGT